MGCHARGGGGMADAAPDTAIAERLLRVEEMRMAVEAQEKVVREARAQQQRRREATDQILQAIGALRGAAGGAAASLPKNLREGAAPSAPATAAPSAVAAADVFGDSAAQHRPTAGRRAKKSPAAGDNTPTPIPAAAAGTGVVEADAPPTKERIAEHADALLPTLDPAIAGMLVDASATETLLAGAGGINASIAALAKSLDPAIAKYMSEASATGGGLAAAARPPPQAQQQHAQEHHWDPAPISADELCGDEFDEVPEAIEVAIEELDGDGGSNASEHRSSPQTSGAAPDATDNDNDGRTESVAPVGGAPCGTGPDGEDGNGDNEQEEDDGYDDDFEPPSDVDNDSAGDAAGAVHAGRDGRGGDIAAPFVACRVPRLRALLEQLRRAFRTHYSAVVTAVTPECMALVLEVVQDHAHGFTVTAVNTTLTSTGSGMLRVTITTRDDDA